MLPTVVYAHKFTDKQKISYRCQTREDKGRKIRVGERRVGEGRREGAGIWVVYHSNSICLETISV